MISITVRHIKVQDLNQFRKTYKNTFKTLFPDYSNRIKDFFVSEKYVEIMMKLPLKLGAFDKEKLVGYLLADKHFGGVIFTFWLAVIPSYQRKGVGKKLLKRIEEIGHEQGVHALYLHSDARHVGYYISRGYEVLAFDKKTYFGTDDYIMKKLISEPDEDKFLK